MTTRLFFDNREFREKAPKYGVRIDSLMEDFVSNVGRNFFSVFVDESRTMVVAKVITQLNRDRHGRVTSVIIEHHNWHPSRRSIEKTHNTEFMLDDPSVSIIQYMKNETKTTEQSLKRLYKNDE